MTKEFFVRTNKRYELVDITQEVENFVFESKAKEGILVVFVPHSTAGVLMTENEPRLLKDWENFFKKLVSGIEFFHNEIDNNAHAHLLSGLVGQERVLVVKEGKVLRGVWQEIFLADFDGPRQRKIILTLVGS